MGMPYEKPHLTFEEQLARLAGRGLIIIPDRQEALDALREEDGRTPGSRRAT
ncbi:MAG: hypothetical protein ACYCZY_04895 [Lacisediminihabitans sp.]